MLYELPISSSNIQSATTQRRSLNALLLLPSTSTVFRRCIVVTFQLRNQFSYSALRFSFLHALHITSLHLIASFARENKARSQSGCIKRQQIENWASADRDAWHTHTHPPPTHTHTQSHPHAVGQLSKLHEIGRGGAVRGGDGEGCCQLELNLIKSFMSACLLKIDKWQFFQGERADKERITKRQKQR